MLHWGKYRVRMVEYHELGKIVDIDARAFGGLSLTKEYFQSWYEAHREGFLVAENKQGEIVGYCMSIRLRRESIHGEWSQDTAGGTCHNHDPNGEILYGVSLASFSSGAGNLLCLESRHLAEKTEGIQEIWVYGRLREFKKWKEENCAHEDIGKALEAYVSLELDPIQRFYDSAGLSIYCGVKGYLPEDDESLGCAVWTLWVVPQRVRQGKLESVEELVLAA